MIEEHEENKEVETEEAKEIFYISDCQKAIRKRWKESKRLIKEEKKKRKNSVKATYMNKTNNKQSAINAADYAKEIINLTLPFIESKQMQNHLRKPENDLAQWCVDVIFNSRGALAKKAAALQALDKPYKKYAELCGWEYKDDPVALAKGCLLSLAELNDNCPAGTIFELRERRRIDDNVIVDGEQNLFTTFDAAVKYLKKSYTKCCDPDDDNIHYSIKKWLPNAKGGFNKNISFTLSGKGEIWFAFWNYQEKWNRFSHSKHHSSQDYYKWFLDEFSVWHDYIHLPYPFEVGDIVTIDGTPFAEKFHAVVSEKGKRDASPNAPYGESIKVDECENYGFRAIYLRKTYDDDEKAYIDTAEVGLGYDFSGSKFPELLRAEKYNGELEGAEQELLVIAEALRGNAELGGEVFDAVEGGRFERWKEVAKKINKS